MELAFPCGTFQAVSTEAQVYLFHSVTGFYKLQPKLAACLSTICVKLFHKKDHEGELIVTWDLK